MTDTKLVTITSSDQADLEKRVRAFYEDFVSDKITDDDESLILDREVHAKYLRGGLGELPGGFSSLDASRPWICFWILHSLALLQQDLPTSPPRDAIIAFLASCQHPHGGFGGGPHQLPHLATTYAAVAALVTLGGHDALQVVDREALRRFLLSMCVPGERGGGMTMHQGGEVDVRGCYCALAACHMLGMDSTVEAVAQACSLERFVADCQSHEGGIGGEPWNEAHGGYTFCGFASLMLAGRAHAIDVELLERWGVRMQGWMEGGFMGRTNKLVDGCYSLWQGGIFPILRRLYREQGRKPRGAPQSLAKDEAAVERLQVAAEAVRQEWSGGMNAVIEAILATEVLPPEAAAQAGVLRAQAALDAAVEQCVAAETELRAAVGAEDESAIAQKKATAAATLEAASNAQEALERAEAHAQSAVHAACSIVASREPLLGADGLAYDARALQVWLLVCCQMAKGGLRDKPGKGADYYHTCYCLSGLSSAQHASGLSLGGERNRLAAADPLCNVEETRLAEAREYFLNATVDSGTATQDT